MPEYNRPWPTPLALFLGGIAKQNGITPRGIGGVADHVHLLLSLPTTVPIAKAIQLVKAGSLAAPPSFAASCAGYTALTVRGIKKSDK